MVADHGQSVLLSNTSQALHLSGSGEHVRRDAGGATDEHTHARAHARTHAFPQAACRPRASAHVRLRCIMTWERPASMQGRRQGTPMGATTFHADTSFAARQQTVRGTLPFNPLRIVRALM
jgi:hypothetical protein